MLTKNVKAKHKAKLMNRIAMNQKPNTIEMCAKNMCGPKC